MCTKIDRYWMSLALEKAGFAQKRGEVPVGAVLVKNGKLVASGWNQPISSSDPSQHAEIVCIREACKLLDNYRIPDCDLYVTLEPCTMCAGAIVHSRIRRLIFGAYEPRAGVAVSQMRFFESQWLNHKVEVIPGVLEEKCGQILKEFFRTRRK